MILACLDNSPYAGSVCDHAAWLAGRMESPVMALHAVAPGASTAAADPILAQGVQRLSDQGAAVVKGASSAGDLVALAAESSAEMVVLGKRGLDSQAQRDRLGASVERMIRSTVKPILLAPKTFLPINRALVFLDSDLAHRAAIRFVAAHPGLQPLNLDVVVLRDGAGDPHRKTQLARTALAHLRAKVFEAAEDAADSGALRLPQARATDLIIVSRAVLLPRLARSLSESDGFWSWRTPVIVC